MNIIQTENAPAAIGPYSQAVIDNGTLYCSGQIGLDPATMQLVDGLEGQIDQILSNITAVLEAANCSKESIVKTTIFLTNIADFETVNQKYAAFMGDHRPARSTIQVAALPKGALVEIEITARVS